LLKRPQVDQKVTQTRKKSGFDMTVLPTIGFIGLGEMGGPMARNLVRAGYRVIGFDLDGARLGALAQAGVECGEDAADVVQRCEVIATSLPSSDSWVKLAENEILPHVRPGQLLIDFGTVTPPETRRLAASLHEQGCDLIDAPVSGGGSGAEQARLYMFVGASARWWSAVCRSCRRWVAPTGSPIAGRRAVVRW
jgi:3-hydroxyisobutyrate dehydrogenase-like beta-hydroxyacid dehydrogenase